MTTASPQTMPLAPAAGFADPGMPQPPVTRPFRQRHPVLSAIGLGLSAGFLGLMLMLGLVTIVVPKVIGGVPLTVVSASMEPTLPVGSMIVVRPVTPEQIRIGDIVSYQPYPLDPTLITHRVTAITQHQDGSFVFTMRGDNNAVDDDPVRGTQVRAVKMYSIPLLGHVNSWVNAQHRHWVIPVVAGGLFAYAGWLFIGAAVDRRRKATVV